MEFVKRENCMKYQKEIPLSTLNSNLHVLQCPSPSSLSATKTCFLISESFLSQSLYHLIKTPVSTGAKTKETKTYLPVCVDLFVYVCFTSRPLIPAQTVGENRKKRERWLCEQNKLKRKKKKTKTKKKSECDGALTRPRNESCSQEKRRQK